MRKPDMEYVVAIGLGLILLASLGCLALAYRTDRNIARTLEYLAKEDKRFEEHLETLNLNMTDLEVQMYDLQGKNDKFGRIEGR